MNESKALVLVRERAWIEPERRARLLRQWANSGQSARTFAGEVGVSMHQLYEWRRDARRQATPVAMVAVPVPGSGQGVAEVLTREGSVRFSALSSPVWAAQLVRELNRC